MCSVSSNFRPVSGSIALALPHISLAYSTLSAPIFLMVSSIGLVVVRRQVEVQVADRLLERAAASIRCGSPASGSSGTGCRRRACGMTSLRSGKSVEHRGRGQFDDRRDVGVHVVGAVHVQVRVQRRRGVDQADARRARTASRTAGTTSGRRATGSAARRRRRVGVDLTADETHRRRSARARECSLAGLDAWALRQLEGGDEACRDTCPPVRAIRSLFTSVQYAADHLAAELVAHETGPRPQMISVDAPRPRLASTCSCRVSRKLVVGDARVCPWPRPATAAGSAARGRRRARPAPG